MKTTFNSQRFMNFARFDLAINRTFYRNLTLITVIGSLGIATACFAGRYLIWHSSAYDPMDGGMHTYIAPDSIAHYNSMFATSLCMLQFLSIMSIIFAGSWAHNLRNKQGRITELTLPATNLEKFLWHALLMVGGGLLLCIAALLLADGLNALLTLCFCPAGDGVASLTVSVSHIAACDIAEIARMVSTPAGIPIKDALLIDSFGPFIQFIVYALMLCTHAVYHFGNAVKYKYNIIWTYVALYALQIAGIIITVALIFACTSIDWDIQLSPDEALNSVCAGMFAIGCVTLAIAFALPLWSYRLYAKAQITSKRNK